MKFFALFSVTFAVLGLVSSGSLAASPTHSPGVRGQIVLAPSCPGPERIDQAPCSTGLSGGRVQLLTTAGEVLSTTVANDRGQFVIQAPPGVYRLHVDVQGLYPRCEDVGLKIAAHRHAHARLLCDSGMR